MSNINDLFPSKYLKASDLAGRPLSVTIEALELEKMRDGAEKPALYFHGKEQGLILNKTNGMYLAEAFGEDYNQWKGKIIQLVSQKVDFGGKRVDAIRIHVPAPIQPVSDDMDLDKDVPF